MYRVYLPIPRLARNRFITRSQSPSATNLVNIYYMFPITTVLFVWHSRLAPQPLLRRIHTGGMEWRGQKNRKNNAIENCMPTGATSELRSSLSWSAADIASCNLRASSFASRMASGSFLSWTLDLRCQALTPQNIDIDVYDTYCTQY